MFCFEAAKNKREREQFRTKQLSVKCIPTCHHYPCLIDCFTGTLLSQKSNARTNYAVRIVICNNVIGKEKNIVLFEPFLH